MSDQDDITLIIGSTPISGWTDIRMTAGIERCTRNFAVSLTERYPGDSAAIIAKPGDKVQVLLGGDLVLTGAINRFKPRITKDSHTITIAGRGKCQDLVDCSAEWPGSQIGGMFALGIAQKLADAYGINVTGEAGVQIPQFNLINTETAWDVIERIARYSKLIAYELPDGSLTLAEVGTVTAASGASEGANGQINEMDWSDDLRYSDYEVFFLAFDSMGDIPDDTAVQAHAVDSNVARHRLLKIVAEADAGGISSNIAADRAIWEMNRRIGRSAMLTTTIDDWRDSSRTLWTPNTLIPVRFPSLKLPDSHLLLSQVTFSRNNETGTTAELVAMPAGAFMPEPFVWIPFGADIAQAIAETP